MKQRDIIPIYHISLANPRIITLYQKLSADRITVNMYYVPLLPAAVPLSLTLPLRGGRERTKCHSNDIIAIRPHPHLEKRKITEPGLQGHLDLSLPQ